MMAAILLLALITMQRLPAETALSFEEAMGRIAMGIESAEVSEREAWEASQAVWAMSLRDPHSLARHTAVIVREIRNLDRWDSYTEISGEYKLSLIRSLFPLEDPALVPVFIAQCQHGMFVTEGLTRIGPAAVPALVQEATRSLSPRMGLPCVLTALTRIAERELGPQATLARQEQQRLVRNYILPVIAHLQEIVSRLRTQGNPLAAGYEERLAQLERVIQAFEQGTGSERGQE